MARKRHQEELDRVLSYLDNSTERVLIKTFLKEYIDHHASALINMEHSGLIHMIKNEKYDEIRLMHELFSKVPEAYNVLKQALHSYIFAEGSKLVNDDLLKHDQFVGQIISLRERMLSMLAQSFERDPSIDVTIKTAFEAFVNQIQPDGTSVNPVGGEKTAMALVYYLDDKFKKDFKGLSEAEINEKLDKVIQIFRYLQDKDIFEGFYKNSLAKRLLDQRSNTSEEQERLLVLKLKEECGFQFTQKLEVMFKDIRMSEETMGEFKGTGIAKQLQIDLNVKVS